MARFILFPDYAVVKHPKSLSFAEAASIWMMFLTAYGAIIADAKVTKGDFVLIPAASSSVGLAAIQLTNYAGATPIALTRTSAKKSSYSKLVQHTSLQLENKIWLPK
jgi:NADPH:quinone reductase-like Zn-dependent oxidoreductase